MTAPLAAVTGGSGFVGGHIVRAFLQAGWQVRMLTRRPVVPPALAGLAPALLPGDLASAETLARLVSGASVVVHAAGLVKARKRDAFMAVNRDGAGRLAEAVARVAPEARIILISSQAARRPELSDYAASKREGEARLTALLGAQPAVVLRPGVVYGPWDWEGTALPRLARLRLAPVPARPEPRLAMIHATDLATAVLALAEGGPASGVFELSDERLDGYGTRELLRVVGALLGRRPIPLAVPDFALRVAGALRDALGGRPAIFGRGKVRELLHRDWRADPAARLPACLWTPKLDLAAGMRDTLRWWRQMGVV